MCPKLIELLFFQNVFKVIQTLVLFFCSFQLMLSGVSLLAVSNVNNPVRLVGLSLRDVVSSFLCHTHTDGKDQLLEWPDRSCLLLKC